MRQILQDLIKSMLNATLLLIALCLYLGWQTVSAIDGLSSRIAARLAPVETRVENITVALSELRVTLAERPQEGGVAGAAMDRQLFERLDLLTEQLAEVNTSLNAMRHLPRDMITGALEEHSSQIGKGLAGQLTNLANCTRPAPENDNAADTEAGL